MIKQYIYNNVILGLAIIAPFSSFAKEWSVVRTNEGHPHYHVLEVPKDLGARYTATGTFEVSSYFVIPKRIAVNYEILNQGHAFRIHIPSPTRYASAGVGPTGYERLVLPPRLSLGNSSWLLDRMQFHFRAGFSEWMKILSPKTQVYYYDDQVRGGLRQVSLSDFRLEEFIQRARKRFEYGNEAILTFVDSERDFGESDALRLQGSVALSIDRVVTGTDTRELEYVFPDPSLWYGKGPYETMPFYSAYEAIDSRLYPMFARDPQIKTLGGSAFAQVWRRSFNEAAVAHYFVDAADWSGPVCRSFGVRIQEDTHSGAFGVSYFAPQLGSIESELVLEEGK